MTEGWSSTASTMASFVERGQRNRAATAKLPNRKIVGLTPDLPILHPARAQELRWQLQKEAEQTREEIE